MKKVFVLILICLSTVMSVFSQGVNFENLTFQQALDKARAENKLVFVDCTTDWCGPCKNMTENIFPQKVCGDFFNRHFINLTIDAEKGEGLEITKKYDLTIFPTFLIITPDGTEQHRIVGAADAQGIIEKVQKGLTPETATGYQDRLYAEESQDKTVLTAYIQHLLNILRNDKAKSVTSELMALLSDEEKQSQEYWFIYNNGILSGLGSENFSYMVRNKDKFVALHGKNTIDEKIYILHMNAFMQTLHGLSSFTVAEMESIEKEIPVCDVPTQKELLASLEIVRSFTEKNPSKMLAVCEKEFKQLTETSATLGILVLEYLQDNVADGERSRFRKLVYALTSKIKDEQLKQYLITRMDAPV